MANLAKRCEEALAVCASMRSHQEDRDVLVRKLESLEVLMQRVWLSVGSLEKRQAALVESQAALVESVKAQGEEEASVQQLRKEVDALHAEVRQRANSSSLDAVKEVLDENARMKQELTQMRKESERRDLEVAEVQGQISALTELFREQTSGMLGTRVRYSGA